jgi:hypothetical protein
MIHLVFLKVTKYLLIQHQKLKFFQHKHASGDARQPKAITRQQNLQNKRLQDCEMYNSGSCIKSSKFLPPCERIRAAAGVT